MAWYKTGAVTINNGATSVTGIGTKFVSNSRVGDGFRGPDGEWYELINQGSETTIGIYPPYAGPSVVASTDYMIAPLQGYNKETADRLRFITDNIRDFTEDVEAAAASAAAAKVSEDAAKQSEINAKASEDNVQVNADAAAASEQAAAASEAAASQSQQAASISETNAKKSETNSSISEVNSKTSETNAAASAEAARLSAEAAALSEINAKGSEDNAKVSETNSKGSETSAAEDAATATAEATAAATAKTQAEVAQAAAEKAARDAEAAAGTVTGQLMDQGPWDASTGVYPARPVVSSFWKVTGNGSATDNGVTISYGIGDTLMYSKTPLDEFYKIDNTESVSSVAGKTGVVDLDKDDVGLDQVDNTSDANKPISNATQAALDIRVPTTSRQDTTAGHLVKVGDYGDNGGSAITVANTTDANTINVSGLYAFTGGTNIPDQNVYLRHMKYEVAGNCKQLAWGLLNDKEWVRTQVNSVWSTWVPVSDIVDALTSTDPTKVLSANQGNVLYNMIQANNATIVQYAYNIPTATTVISGADTSGKALSYVPGAALIVVLNGFNLRQGVDFTATTGTSISLNKAIEAASEINITVFGSFSVADMYTKSETDVLLQNVAAQSAEAILTVKWVPSRQMIGLGTVPLDGGTYNRATYPDAWALIRDGKVPKTTEALWASDLTARASFTEGDGTTTFRVPDYNGKSAGSYQALFLRGDGALAAAAGVIQRDAFQDHQHTIPFTGQGVTNGYTSYKLTNNAIESQGATSNAALGRVATETRPINVSGVWTIRLFGSTSNVGNIDVAQLSSQLNTVDNRLVSVESYTERVYGSRQIGDAHVNPQAPQEILWSVDLVSKGITFGGISDRYWNITNPGVYKVRALALSGSANCGFTLIRVRGGTTTNLAQAFAGATNTALMAEYTGRFLAGDKVGTVMSSGNLNNAAGVLSSTSFTIERIDN